MPLTKKYAPGDRVIRTSWPAGESGTIVKSSLKTALVRFDGREKDERLDLTCLRPETPEEAAKREHARLLEGWREVCPKTSIAAVEYDGRWGHAREEIGASLKQCRTPAEMRTAAKELKLLAEWFEQRPKEKGC